MLPGVTARMAPLLILELLNLKPLPASPHLWHASPQLLRLLQRRQRLLLKLVLLVEPRPKPLLLALTSIGAIAHTIPIITVAIIKASTLLVRIIIRIIRIAFIARLILRPATAFACQAHTPSHQIAVLPVVLLMLYCQPLGVRGLVHRRRRHVRGATNSNRRLMMRVTYAAVCQRAGSGEAL
jgi:hypothetical protein